MAVRDDSPVLESEERPLRGISTVGNSNRLEFLYFISKGSERNDSPLPRMLLLLTGSSGLLGSAVLEYLLKDGHSVVGVDVRPSQRRPPKGPSRFTDYTMDLSDYWRLDKIFETHNFDGVVHLSAIPSPIGLDGRMVHNVNVTTTYNVLATAARHGVKRLVQASSVNAIGLAFTPVDRLFLPRFPITEQASYQDVSHISYQPLM